MSLILPRNDHEKILAIRLYRSKRIGPGNYEKLLEKAGGFESAWALLEETYQKNSIPMAGLCARDAAEKEFEFADQHDCTLLVKGDGSYPAQLQETENAPPFVWTLGDLSLLKREQIAVIGARNASLEGVRTTREFSRRLAEMGFSIVSGLARGIDAAAHEGAIVGGTIGVVAGGLDVFYPRQNKQLQELMSERGLLISEMPFGHKPQACNFPQRNRIIAGLASGVLVVEATQRSGTMITAEHAVDFGREVMAIPGHPLSARSAGPNQLIREGATLVRSVDDILEALNKRLGGVPITDDFEDRTSFSQIALESPRALAQQGLDEIEGRIIRGADGEMIRVS